MGNCHFKTDFDTDNITGKYHFAIMRGAHNQRPGIGRMDEQHEKCTLSNQNY